MENAKIKKVCSFNISGIHFSMMILPYIKRELNTQKEVITILEKNLEKNIDQILSKLTTTDEEKEKISNVNWNETDIKKTGFEEYIREKIINNNDLDIIVYGGETFINNVGKIVDKIIDNNLNKNITIIDCYAITDFNENMKNILSNHDVMFNTSGEHDIEKVFQNVK